MNPHDPARPGVTTRSILPLPRHTHVALLLFWFALMLLTVLRSHDAIEADPGLRHMSLGQANGTTSSHSIADAQQSAAAIASRWDVTVLWRDPSRFYSWPLTAVPPGVVIQPVKQADLVPALTIVTDAFSTFPAGFVRTTMSKIFLCGTLTVDGNPLSGLALSGAIYLATKNLSEPEGRTYMRDTIFHESSTLVLYKVGLDEAAWKAVNPPGFQYVIVHDPDAKLHATHWHDDPAELNTLYAGGFLLRYGTASLRNDLNTYADLAFGHPEDAVSLMHRSPRVARKMALMMAMYLKADPAFRGYFDRTGLTGASAS